MTHDVLEGALQYEVKIMLKEMVYDERYFTLEVLNSRPSTIELGYIKAIGRPSAISEHKVSGTGHSLSQAGTYCYTPVSDDYLLRNTQQHKCGYLHNHVF